MKVSFEPRRRRLPEIPGISEKLWVQELSAEHSILLDNANTIRANVLYRGIEKPADFNDPPDHTDLIIWTIVSKDGKPIFNESDRDSLKRMPVSIYNLLVNASLELSREEISTEISERMDKDNPLDT